MPLDLLRRLTTPLRHPVDSSRYPEAAPLLQEGTRGLPKIDLDRCRNDGACVESCPTGAIKWTAGAVESIDAGKCIFCAACVLACPNGAMEMTTRVELASGKLEGLIDPVAPPRGARSGGGTKAAGEKPPAGKAAGGAGAAGASGAATSGAVDATGVSGAVGAAGVSGTEPADKAGAVEARAVAAAWTVSGAGGVAVAGGAAGDAPAAGDAEFAEHARIKIHGLLGRSLHVRHLDAGSCNGCDWEVAALLNAYHDVQRLGIDFVASPRHADLLLVTGVMTRHLEEAARRTYDAMAEPRMVVAMGACAISGGVFAGSPHSGDGAEATFPVDVYVPGCPPRPEAIIEGLLMALELRK
jgi:Ni,Fe-hydrogenase III small subunit/ferredoxin